MPIALRRAWLLLLAPAAVVRSAVILQEVFVPLPQGGQVAFSTRGPLAFRVRFLFDDDGAMPIDTPMVGPDDMDAAFKAEATEEGTGIVSDFGSVKVSLDGTLVLSSADGRLLTESRELADKQMVVLSTNDGALYGRGASPEDAGSLTSKYVTPLVCNRATYVPYYWSTDGYGALGVVSAKDTQRFPATYRSDGKQLTWSFQGNFELYLMPAPSLPVGTQAYYALIGAPRVPPRYAFGFMASRWGWQDRADIESTLAKFRQDKYPIDAIICDFEWFTEESDYGYSPAGQPNYRDFGYNPTTFPEPAAQFAAYDLQQVHVGAIRKPRLGNPELLTSAKAQGWTLPGGVPAGSYPPDIAGTYAQDRCLDFSRPEVRTWYAQQIGHFTQDGLAFWWNDEGETDYFTFHWWNVAELEGLRNLNKTKRFYSLNRAWTPGMARLGATVWTGDINPSWEDLKGTPGMMLNWILGGAPYVACDIGGFSGETSADLLTRWMQVGVFMPTMRVHSTLTATPHWPWLWGDDAAAAIRQALELRYRLVPYHYSLAHGLFRRLALWVRPLVVEFPGDGLAADITTEWMDGDILVAPILGSDSQKRIYLPEGRWYPLSAMRTVQGEARGAPQIIQGPVHIHEPGAFSEVPAFVRAGTVLPLAPIMQSTEMLPAGPLEVQVYAGADGAFELVEDDGESVAYEAGHVRVTKFKWNDSASTLSWVVTGHLFAPGRKGFTHVYMTLIRDSGIQRSDTWLLGIVGSIDTRPSSSFI